MPKFMAKTETACPGLKYSFEEALKIGACKHGIRAA